MSLDKALDQLKRSYNSCDMRKFHQFCFSDTHSKFDCNTCEKTAFNKWDLFQHFFSVKHIRNFSPLRAGVSENAVKHWLFWLQQAASDPAAAAENDSSVFSGVVKI
ncbi:hypothetical protein PMAYCL1PPCAC_07593, partial [Pristionchus mayeri]